MNLRVCFAKNLNPLLQSHYLCIGIIETSYKAFEGTSLLMTLSLSDNTLFIVMILIFLIKQIRAEGQLNVFIVFIRSNIIKRSMEMLIIISPHIIFYYKSQYSINYLNFHFLALVTRQSTEFRHLTRNVSKFRRTEDWGTECLNTRFPLHCRLLRV